MIGTMECILEMFVRISEVLLFIEYIAYLSNISVPEFFFLKLVILAGQTERQDICPAVITSVVLRSFDDMEIR